MAIITISRQAGSLSREIAPALAKKFGWFYIDKNNILDALEKYNIDTEIIEKYDEKKPSFRDSFFLENEKFFNYFKLYFFEKAVENKGCVLLGRGGSFLLKGAPGVLRIRLVSSDETRIERLMHEFGYDEKEAKKVMKISDHERIGFHKYYYHEDWSSPESYDITFNTDYFSTDSVSTMLSALIESYLKEGYDAEGQKYLKNMLTAQKIIIRILYEKNIAVHLLEVEVEDGKATIAGTVEVDSMIDQCGKAAKIAGIESVENNIVFISQYPPII